MAVRQPAGLGKAPTGSCCVVGSDAGRAFANLGQCLADDEQGGRWCSFQTPYTDLYVSLIADAIVVFGDALYGLVKLLAQLPLAVADP